VVTIGDTMFRHTAVAIVMLKQGGDQQSHSPLCRSTVKSDMNGIYS
jgi:hypothetical protein